MSYSKEQIEMAIKMLELASGGSKQVGQKHDLVPAAGVGPYAHGNGGLFSTPGIGVNVFSAIPMPQSILNELPVMPAGTSAPDGFGGYDVPLTATLTGVTSGDLDTWSNQPDAPCDNPPYGGLVKLCVLANQFGRFYGAIRPVDVTHLARLVNRGEPTDLNLVNSPLNQGGFLRSAFMGGDLGNSAMLSELDKRLIESATSFARGIMPLAWTGDPTNNKAGGGAKQFLGLEYWVNTGNKRDFISSAVCTALDSDVKNFNYNLVTDDDPSIVEYLDAMYNYLESLAEDIQLDPVEWRFVMRRETFDEITKVWPIRYYEEFLSAVSPYSGGRVNFDARDAGTMRDELRNGKFLPIRGKRIPVIIDTTMPRDTSATAPIGNGVYSSDIYMIPWTVRGGRQVSYIETFNYDAGRIQEFLSWAGIEADAYATSDGGRFLFWRHRTNVCIDLRWLTEFRIVLETPQLAGRLTDVATNPLQLTRDWQPGSGQYSTYRNGGVTQRPQSSYYVAWSSTPQIIGS